MGKDLKLTLDTVTAVLGATAILWTLLPLLRHDAWWIRVFEFPRVQITILSAGVLVVYLALAGWRDAKDLAILAALSVCIVFQLVRIVRYTPLHPKQVKSAVNPQSANSLGFLVANVLMPNRNAEALLKIIGECNPDVVLALETDRWWESKLDALVADYPHTVKHPLENLYGIHLYSRLELTNPQVLFLVEDDVPSVHATVRLRSGHCVDLHCLHPAPPSPTENPTAAERDAELLVVAKTLASEQGSAVVMGDLNDVAWSATTRLFQKLSGLLDPRIGRGPYSTFHAKYPLLRWPLDHVFCSSDFTLVSLARRGYFGSDHFPLHIVLSHTPGAQAGHERPQGNDADHARAEEKIDKVGADQDALGFAAKAPTPRGRASPLHALL